MLTTQVLANQAMRLKGLHYKTSIGQRASDRDFEERLVGKREVHLVKQYLQFFLPQVGAQKR
jgi:hypothetical protein